MSANNVLSYRILLFEREADGAFVPPEAYPELALTATGTHDMPPLAGWLTGEDIDLRERLGGDPAAAHRERVSRELDITQLRAALLAHGGLRESDAWDADALVLAAYRYLAQTPARIVMLQIEDALGERTPVNVPGTDREYPNWRRKLRDDLETLSTDERFERFAAALRELRPRA
jgi:4-alpha-glucanotransferase